MITFTKPAQLNGYQLIDELEAVGVKIKSGTRIIINAQGELLIDIADKDKLKAETIIANHVGIDVVIDNSAAKAALLEKLGITAEEAVLLLS